jgi:hypothetical protein
MLISPQLWNVQAYILEKTRDMARKGEAVTVHDQDPFLSIPDRPKKAGVMAHPVHMDNLGRHREMLHKAHEACKKSF